MGAKLDQHLTAIIAEAESQSSDRALPVIVTLRPDTDLDSLAGSGLEIAHRYEAIAAVSGRIRLADLPALEAIDQVERIELDGEMRALEG